MNFLCMADRSALFGMYGANRSPFPCRMHTSIKYLCEEPKVHDLPVQEQRCKYIGISFKIIRLQIVNIGTLPYILT